MSARFRKFFPILAIFLVGLSVLGILIWNGSLPRWLRERAVKAYLSEVEPHLPFQILDVDVDVDMQRFVAGEISRLKLLLAKGRWRAQLDGAVTIEQKADAWLSLIYRPKLLVSHLEHGTSTPIELSIAMEIKKDLSNLGRFELRGTSQLWQWKKLGLEVISPALSIEWAGADVATHLTLAGAQQSLSDDIAHGLGAVKVEVRIPFDFAAGRLGPRGEAKIRVAGVEVLDGETYLDIPLKKFPLLVLFDIDRELVEIQAPHTRVALQQAAGPRVQVRWKAGPVQLASLPLASLREMGLKIQDGLFEFEGKALWKTDAWPQSQAQGELRLSDVQLSNRKWQTGVKGFYFGFPFQTSRTTEMVFGAKMLQFRNLKAELGPVRVSLKPNMAKRQVEFLAANGVPFKFRRLPVVAGARHVAGVLDWKDALRVKLTSGFDLRVNEARQLAVPLCIPVGYFPPAQVQVNLPRVLFDSSGSFETKGSAAMELFGGKVELSDLQVFDLFTAVPEIRFDTRINRVQLGQIGKWLNFGEMDGTLEGYGRKVILQSWLPTRFDVRIEGRPRSEPKVVFSAQAMKNFVRLLTGDDLDDVFGFWAVDWFMFGPISELLGGYDVESVGVSLFASDGSIVLETLESPEVYKKERKHYILYGSRFKIPIQSSRYPVVLDTTAMAHFGRHVLGTIEGLIATGQAEEEKEDEVCFDFK